MLSSIATHEPLPFVPATVTILYDGERSSSCSSTATNRSRRRSIRFGCTVSNQASQRSSVWPLSGGVITPAKPPGSGQRRSGAELGEQGRDLIASVPPIEDHVDRALLEQELGALKSFRQGLTGCLLDDARPGETDQRARLRHVDVAEQGKARGDATRGRVGHHGHVGQFG